MAVHDGMTDVFRQVLPWRIEIESHLLAEAFQHMPVIITGTLGQPPWLDSAFVEGLRRVGNHQFRVDFQVVPDAGACGACAVRGVE